MSKKKVLEELKGLTDLPMDSLKRLSVYDLNKLLSNLKGVKVEEPRNDKIKAKKIRKKREKKIREFSDDEDETMRDETMRDEMETPEAVEDVGELPENEVVDEVVDEIEDVGELPINEIIDDEKVEEIIPPKKKDLLQKITKGGRGDKSPAKRPKKQKKKEVSIQEEVMEIPHEDTFEKSITQPTPPQPTPPVSKKKKVNEKTEIKSVITEFQKNISLLLQQYKRVKSPTEQHVNNLIEYYNEYNDEALQKIQDIIDKYRFVDDSVIEWTNSLIEKQKIRVERVVG